MPRYEARQCTVTIVIIPKGIAMIKVSTYMLTPKTNLMIFVLGREILLIVSFLGVDPTNFTGINRTDICEDIT